MRTRLGELAQHVSPRHRRYRDLLAGLTLDPDELPRPVEPPSDRDFLMCGSPRSGTSLLCAVLHQPPSVLSVLEPWDGLRLPPAELFASLRREIDQTGRLERGRLDVAGMLRDGRVDWGRDGECGHDVDVDEGYLLGVKWPAFWRYLELLPHTKFLVCLRDPIEVISSYRMKGGRLVLGLEYDVAFNRALNEELEGATRSAALRRILLYDTINLRMLPYLDRPNVFAVRYERWFTDRDGLVNELSDFLGVDLGPGAPVIKPPRTESGLSAKELELIREHCRSAEPLGYALEARAAARFRAEPMTRTESPPPSIRALLVINGLGTGGAERSLAELLPGLVAAGIAPTVACLFERVEGVQDHVLEDDFDVRFIPGGWRRSVRALRRLIRAERPDIVHTTHFESDVAGRIAAWGTGSKVLTSLVNTTYDPVRLEDPDIKAARLASVKAIDGWTARHLTTHFHAITETVKQAAVSALRVDPTRITVIPRGRDPERLGRPAPDRRREARARLGLSDEQQVLLNVARQEFQKGQAYLLEAFVALLEEHPNLILLVAGREGHSSDALQRWLHERPSLEGSIRFLGHRDDIPELLAAADVFVFPSLYEGLGGSLIEAMALGVPIVSSDLPAVREVLDEGRNALLVPPAAPAALARAIGRLLDDPGMRRTFGAHGRRIFEERFSLASSTERMVELYRRVAHPGERPRATGPRAREAGASRRAP